VPRLLIVANVAEMFRDFLLPFARHFRQKGWQVDGMANGISRSSLCAGAFDRVVDVEWSRSPLHPSNFVHAPRTICREVAFAQYDLVHAHTPTAGFVARMALRFNERNDTPKRPKIIYTAHGFHFHPGGTAVKNRIYRSLEKLAGRWTDYLVVINRTDEAAARQYGLVPDDKLVYMPGIGIDLSHYDSGAVQDGDIAAIRRELGVLGDEPLLLMVAEFIPRKRHCDAVRAFASLRDTTAHLVFAGEGPLLTEIRRLTEELGIANRVHFLGYRADIPALIRASAATVLPSEQEGLPRCIMESLSMNTLVISTDIRGCRDLLEDDCGLLVPSGDWRRLAEAMRWVLSNPNEATAMAQRGRNKVASLDINNILCRHEALYEQALRN
jgi:glycosyltransferase involved in cell wall biosynthesis